MWQGGREGQHFLASFKMFKTQKISINEKLHFCRTWAKHFQKLLCCLTCLGTFGNKMHNVLLLQQTVETYCKNTSHNTKMFALLFNLFHLFLWLPFVVVAGNSHCNTVSAPDLIKHLRIWFPDIQSLQKHRLSQLNFTLGWLPLTCMPYTSYFWHSCILSLSHTHTQNSVDILLFRVRLKLCTPVRVSFSTAKHLICQTWFMRVCVLKVTVSPYRHNIS